MKELEKYPNGTIQTKEPMNVLLGRRIRQIRTNLGLSQEAFAFEVGLHRTYVGQIERAEKNITIKNIEKICYALDIDPKDLFDFSELKDNDN